MSDPTQRFTDRVADYAQYRPSYPVALLDELDRLAWSPNAVVADIGAGTGLFTRLVAPRVRQIMALEPNDAMRTQGEADTRMFRSVVWGKGSAEATGLADASLDALVCAQAFHWFDRERTKTEWKRILKPGAVVALVWNERDEEESPLQAEYNQLLVKWCPEYPVVNHKNITPEDLDAFFAPAVVQRLQHRNDQRFDLPGWYGRLRSASYCPPTDSHGYHELTEGMAALFDRHRDPDGLLTFPYVTKTYVSTLS